MEFEEAINGIGEELKAVESEMSKHLFSEIVMIPTVSRYLISSGGKRFRPTLLLLSSRLCGYRGPRNVPLASTIEFIHTATLLHDDVVDRAFVRRGMASANSVYGDGASVLVGDFLLTKSFSIIVQDGNLHILDVVSQATTRMAEGEVMQLVRMGNPGTTEQDYYYIVTNKTAVLMSAACQVGGVLGHVSGEEEQALADFGLNLGIAFQLIDDLLDYASEQEVFGKAIGKDLSEGKITLPLIRTLQVSRPKEREQISEIVRNSHRSPEEIENVMRSVQQYGGIEYTVKRAEEFAAKAKSYLSIFPPSKEKDSLLTLSDYTIRRRL